jgi:catechol 2,3-dioxygenase-like lactoylglutathione lyase family enzyme
MTGRSLLEVPMIKKVAFTMFPVDDTARARAFYEQTLGLERGSSASNGVWTEYDLPGGGCLALFNHPDPNAKGQRGSANASIAFEVDDLDDGRAQGQGREVHLGRDPVAGVPHGQHRGLGRQLDPVAPAPQEVMRAGAPAYGSPGSGPKSGGGTRWCVAAS